MEKMKIDGSPNVPKRHRQRFAEMRKFRVGSAGVFDLARFYILLNKITTEVSRTREEINRLQESHEQMLKRVVDLKQFVARTVLGVSPDLGGK